MWIQVRTIDGKETRTVEDLSRLTKIESLRLKIQEIFNVSPQQQRLFYRGKQVNPAFLCRAAMQQSVCMLWQVSVLVESERSSSVGSRFGLARASCFGRNSPMVLAQEAGGTRCASPRGSGGVTQMYGRAGGRFARVVAGEELRATMSRRRRHVCLHCHEREKKGNVALCFHM